MPKFDPAASFARLTRIAPPPASPLEVGGQLPGLRFADGGSAKFPSDFLTLVQAYGSGEFQSDDELGMVAGLLNPRAPAYARARDYDLETIRGFKEEEGDEYIPYALYPDRPGLLPWGWAECRRHYFWLTEGEPADWPVVVLYDLEIFTRFDMPVVVFLEQLVGGSLEASFIGTPGHFDPARIKFTQRPVIAG